MEINLGSVKMPLNAATKTFAILAKRGAGKTYTAAVMAEEFAKNKIPFVVIDPIDVWWGLRLAANGKDKGLSVVVFGVQHEDIKLDRDMGRKIAQAVVRENVSCVINTFGLPKTAQRHLLAEFADELLNINNTPRHIFIEEAHEYLPQRVFGGLGTVFNAVSNLVVMGRNRGIGVTLINQRAATINKDVLTQLDTLLAFQNTSPQDRKALQDWVEYHSADGDFKKFMDSLPSLPKGEGWIWSPEFMGIFEKIKIRKRETFHPDREKLGNTFEMPELSQLDIQEFVQKFQKENKSEKQGTKPQKQSDAVLVEPIEQVNVTQLRNEYESKLVQKDLEIRQLQKIIQNIKNALGEIQVNTSISAANVGVNTDAVSMWLTKLGNGGPSKILQFLASRPSEGFTRQQLALAIGASYSSVKDVWVPLLKRNLLIKQDGEKLRVNPDL
jgi:hypothetical protein